MVGIVWDQHGRVLVNQRLPGTHMAGHWEFPGGKRSKNEDARAALERELCEELGIEVLAAKPLVDLTHDYPDRRVRLDVWTVLEYRGHPTGRDGQALDWVLPAALESAGLLPADKPIVDWLRDHDGPGPS
ncbi:MAG TPA: (deoxy)nucleoside triphosphate pyrophosphohydrolase [Gammaproteobacteria bacterium]